MGFFEAVLNILNQYGPLYWKGVQVTILLAIVGTIVGLIIGAIIGMYRCIPVKEYTPLPAKILYKTGLVVFRIYIEVFRSTPMMVQAMIIFYGFAWVTGIRVDPIKAGLVIISINTGAYMAEIVRGGITSVEKGQYEAAHSVGLSHWQTMGGVVMPQAIRNIMPMIGNEFIINMKDSCVLSVISVTEVFFMAKSAAGATFETFPAYFVAMVIYLILTLITSFFINRIEKRMDGEDSFELYVDNPQLVRDDHNVVN